MHHGHDNHEGGVAHEIEWAGWYEQFGSKTDVSFQNMQLGNDGKIHGGGKDPNGEFAIHGHLSGNEVKFDKAYKGAHTVNYSGKLDHGVISGKWSLTGMEGTFEIKMKTKQWKGHFTHGGSNFDMLVSLQLNEFKTVDTRLTGLGSDAHGNYSLHGFRPRNHPETVHFKKQYFGQNSAVHYAGVIGNINGHETIKGVWMLPSGDNGTFELVKQL